MLIGRAVRREELVACPEVLVRFYALLERAGHSLDVRIGNDRNFPCANTYGLSAPPRRCHRHPAVVKLLVITSVFPSVAQLGPRPSGRS